MWQSRSQVSCWYMFMCLAVHSWFPVDILWLTCYDSSVFTRCKLGFIHTGSDICECSWQCYVTNWNRWSCQELQVKMCNASVQIYHSKQNFKKNVLGVMIYNTKILNKKTFSDCPNTEWHCIILLFFSQASDFSVDRFGTVQASSARPGSLHFKKLWTLYHLWCVCGKIILYSHDLHM